MTVSRGDYHQPAPGYSFTVNQDVVVYLAVDSRPKAELGEGWEKTSLTLSWRDLTDDIYRKTFKKGQVEIPGHPLDHKPGDYGVPHMAFVQPVAADAGKPEITDLPAKLNGLAAYPASAPAVRAEPKPPKPATVVAAGPVTFSLEIDAQGDGKWTEDQNIAVPWAVTSPTCSPRTSRPNGFV